MEARTALLVALAIAVALPYVTIALLRGGGFFLIGSLFVAAFLLILVSDLRSGGDAPTDGD